MRTLIGLLGFIKLARFGSNMHAYPVSLEVSGLVEGLGTEVTFIGPFTCMGPLMTLE